jgi:hypothetical protein
MFQVHYLYAYTYEDPVSGINRHKIGKYNDKLHGNIIGEGSDDPDNPDADWCTVPARRCVLCTINLMHKCFEFLCSLLMLFGWVYVFYVGHIDKIV